MHALQDAGYRPQPLSSRIFVRCYRRYGDAKRAYDQLRVVAGIPDTRMTVVARGLEWREPLPIGALTKLASAVGALFGGAAALVLWTLGFNDAGWLTQTVLGALAGALVGVVGALIVDAVRRRNPTGVVETGHVEPQQYDIVEEDYAQSAREVLEFD